MSKPLDAARKYLVEDRSKLQSPPSSPKLTPQASPQISPNSSPSANAVSVDIDGLEIVTINLKAFRRQRTIDNLTPYGLTYNNLSSLNTIEPKRRFILLPR